MNIQRKIAQYNAAKSVVESIEQEIATAGDVIFKKIDEFKKKIGVTKTYQMPKNLPDFFYRNNFYSVIHFDNKNVYFKSYVRGWGGDPDEYPESSLPTKLIVDYYNDTSAFDNYFDDVLSGHLDRAANEKLRIQQQAEKAEYEAYQALKKKFENKDP